MGGVGCWRGPGSGSWGGAGRGRRVNLRCKGRWAAPSGGNRRRHLVPNLPTETRPSPRLPLPSLPPQGGIFAVLDPRDSVEAHAHDTMVAGAWLNDRKCAWGWPGGWDGAGGQALHPRAGGFWAPLLHRGEVRVPALPSRAASHRLPPPAPALLLPPCRSAVDVVCREGPRYVLELAKFGAEVRLLRLFGLMGRRPAEVAAGLLWLPDPGCSAQGWALLLLLLLLLLQSAGAGPRSLPTLPSPYPLPRSSRAPPAATCT